VSTLSVGELESSGPVALNETLAARSASLNLNSFQGNPFQADLGFRGFSASPLLGTPQGLSVYLDGVRANEAFGDVVNWDFIPRNALATVDLHAGSNPVFGLNTLGGAIALHTRSGFSSEGGVIEAEGGSFGRRALSADYGTHAGEWGGYLAVHGLDEDGWRDFSPTRIRQAFGKLSRQTDRSDVDLSVLHADNDLTGNGLVPASMLASRREQVFTLPDNTRHDLTQANLGFGHWLDGEQRVEGRVYVRQVDSRTLNGDANDDFEEDPALDGAEGANGGLGFNQETAANNRTATRQRGHGAAAQWTLAGGFGQALVGASFDDAKSNFSQSVETGIFDSDRRPVGDGNQTIENEVDGRTRSAGLYLSGLWHLSERLHVSASGRFNRTRVTMVDRLDLAPPNLDGDHRYRKFNPALGAAWDAAPSITVYGGFNQGSRAPTPLELGCADPTNPCTLPNAMAADPFLEQVVTRTVEAGVRGGGEALAWRVGAFRSENRNDILFVGTSTSAGYFTNFGRTRRTGAEIEASGSSGIFGWSSSLSFLRAEFADSACLLAENNSSRGQDAACTGAGQDDEILVSSGNRLPGVAEKSLKLTGTAQITPAWQFGLQLAAYSSQYVRGNENNRHQAGDATDAFGTTRTFEGGGTVPGYAVVNLRSRFRLGAGWELLARIDNLFNREYATGGALAENPFDAAGAFQTSSDDWTRETFSAPGAPRSAWVGVRYAFGGR
jgi:outer membrane receptor protein involved in Fe transport